MKRLAILMCALSGAHASETELVGFTSDCEFIVPSETNGGSTLAPADWTDVEWPPNWEMWNYGQLGIGYAAGGDTYYLELLSWEIFELMRYINPSLYVRAPFSAAGLDLAELRQMTLRMRFDDGFIAYLNGVEVMRFNAPEMALWNSTSQFSYPDSSGSQVHRFNLSEHLDLLNANENVLAVQLLNNSTGSQDAIVLPELSVGVEEPDSFVHPRYLEVLTIDLDTSGYPRFMTVGTAVGRVYQLQLSSDLETWIDIGQPILSLDQDTRFSLGGGREPRFYRVAEL